MQPMALGLASRGDQDFYLDTRTHLNAQQFGQEVIILPEP